MREKFLQYLMCPLTRNSFDLAVFERDGEQVLSGLLTTKDGEEWYPIIHGIPRMLINELKQNLLLEHHAFFRRFEKTLPEKIRSDWKTSLESVKDFDAFLRHQKKTAESFAYEWKHIYQENSYEKNNFFHFLSPFIQEADVAGRTTLDIGCGSGRFTKWAALSGTAASFGTDLGESVEVAYALTKDLPNVCIVQADIYAMPFEHQFDFAYSIGVLHHLPKPEAGFQKLPPVLKPGGRMLIWVYNRRNNARALYVYEPLRSLLKHVPKPLLYKLCYVPGILVHGINGFGHWLGSLGFPEVEEKLPFSYYRHFPFNMKLNDAFDVLATPKSNYYYREEIVAWFQRANLAGIECYEHPEAGITCTGIYGS